MKETILGIITLITAALSPVSQAAGPLLSPISVSREIVLAEHQLDLSIRNQNSYTNEVFAENILLAIAYFDEAIVLEPGETFAFHEMVLPEFSHRPLKTGWTKYTAAEGYKTVGGLPGNGICHLATLMNWVATDVGLEVIAKVNHDFAPVPGVPREYGTSIRYMPDGSGNSANQNLYIINSLGYPVKFVFEASENWLNLKILRPASTGW